MSLFKTNYSYKLKTLFTPQQAKKIIEKLIQLHRNLYKLVKLVQKYIKKYLKNQILKKEIKSTYLPNFLKVSNLVRS